MRVWSGGSGWWDALPLLPRYRPCRPGEWKPSGWWSLGSTSSRANAAINNSTTTATGVKQMFGSGGGNRTRDAQVMGLVFYH